MGGYARLNLRFNPFGELSDDDRATVACVDVARLLTHLDTPRAALQLVAKHGRGKTTRLLALRDALGTRATFVRVEHDGSALLPTPCAPVLLVDRFELARGRTRHRLLRAAPQVVLSVHRGARWRLRAYGFTPITIPVGIDTPTSTLDAEAALAAIFSRRLEFARASSGAIPIIPPDTLRVLRQQHGDNIRAMENSLFDAVAALPTIGAVSLDTPSPPWSSRGQM